MLEFFRNVAQTIPDGPSSDGNEAATAVEPAAAGSARDMLQDRAGIIVLREDLDFYAIPPRADIEQHEMIEVKRAAGKALLKQDGIFSGLRRSEEPGTTEQHLIEMLTAGYAPFPATTLTTNQPRIFANINTEASTTTTAGDTAPASQTRLSSALSLLLVSAPISEAQKVATLSVWRRSCCCSGASQLGDVGGRVWSLMMLRVWRGR